ncbi:MAG TPA: glycosyltransferase family 39 protein [Candidatus Polarisedimenticolia bacterium]|nr:glycosyltransferase family 39 protein [Candidatus Polarisedimenticolia bacterium]
MRAAPVLLVAVFVLGALFLMSVDPAWDSLSYSTWQVGWEAGRIARNLVRGLGYDSPFLALPGDNFLCSPPGDDDAGIASPVFQEDRPGSEPTAWVTPPYVLLWAGMFLLFGVYTPAAAAAFTVGQIALMAVALGLAWRLVQRLRGARTALLALALLVLYPSTWWFAVEDTHGEALFLVFLIGTLFTLERIVSGARGPWLVLHALAVALAVLTEPVSLFFYLWLEVWAAFKVLPRRTGDARGGRRLLAASAIACVLVIGPWLLRNLVVLGAPIPFKSNLPMEIYYGNNEDSAWNLHLAHVRRFPAWNEEERLRLLAVGEPAYGKQCLLQAAMFLHEHPLTVARLTLQRISYVWSYNPFRTTTWRPTLTLLFHLALGFWAAALLLLGRSGRDWFDRACFGFLLFYPVIYYVTHFMIYRYRYPLEAVLLLGTAAAWGRLAGWVGEPSDVMPPAAAPPSAARP